jgi:hypothetical protein
MKPIPTLLFCLALFYNCSSTRITSTWKASDASAQAYEKIMVVGIIKEADARCGNEWKHTSPVT